MFKKVWQLQPDDTLHPRVGSFEQTLRSNEGAERKDILNFFGEKPFMLLQAQNFDQFPLVNPHLQEEEKFSKKFDWVLSHSVPLDKNFLSLHTIYQIKANGDSSLVLKTRSAFYYNRDTIETDMRLDCCVCTPLL